ncbi:MAG: hypothetical protein AAFY88_25240, partial [Acidobacteriota bacterium]
MFLKTSRAFQAPAWKAVLTVIVMATALVGPGPALAEDSSSDGPSVLSRFRTHFLGGWSVGETDGNTYLSGEEDANAENANVAFNLSYDAGARWRFAAQVEGHSGEVGGEGEEVELDFLYATYSFAEGLQIRLGRVKHAFGIYSEFFDLGTIRPFLDLPQSIYGPSGLAGESLDGISFAGTRTVAGGWEWTYDLYYGELELVTSEPWDLLEADDDDLDFDDDDDASELFFEERNRDEVIGARST